VLKNYYLLITILYSIALATLCLVQLNSVNKVGIPFADKIFHFLSYVVLTILWYNTCYFYFKKAKANALILAIVVSISFGIIIEVLQGTVTSYRSSDINDVFANSLGVLLTAFGIGMKNKYLLK